MSIVGAVVTIAGARKMIVSVNSDNSGNRDTYDVEAQGHPLGPANEPWSINASPKHDAI